ncbi:Protocadherin-11 X-linked [Taenia crassiceps]|uniref:Protocadherin-11 X-linked n=1 Tax=Taenia crassiceps TaxID=6207 RepID=A0ABR4QNW3_9CEST
MFQIIEESSNGTEIGGVSEYLHNAIGVDPQATFQLLDSHEMLTRLLKIESQTGRLYIDGRVDREALCSQSSGIALTYLDPEASCVKQINILATAQAENNQEVSVQTIPIKLMIQDVNDNTPSWNSAGKQLDGLPILEANIIEQGSGNKILVPAAYDPDSGRNGEISYRLENYRSLSSGDSNELDQGPAPFTISGPISGMLQLTPFQPIDYEKQSVYDLLLIASDAGEPPNVGRAHLRINVIDVNDECPVFTQQIFTPPGGGGISERTHPGEVILNVTAVDGDASERNSRLTYSMVPSSNRLIGEIFSVHPDGRIILRHWLDYETLEPGHMASSTSALREAPPTEGKQFAFYVKATDSAPPPYEKTGTALVVIPIIDENDERPIITSRFLGSPELVKHGESGVITENSSVPVRLAYIQARDPDFEGRDRVECTVPDNENLSLRRVTPLTHRPSTGDVNMPPKNNDFLLSLEEPVDRETTKVLQIRIHCVDEANNTADLLINIRVLDVNDETPSFLRPVFYFSVNENTKVPSAGSGANGTLQGYRIGRVIAYDKDEGDNAKIMYGLLPTIEIEEPKLRPSLFPLSDYGHEIAPTQASDLFRIDSITGELFALRSFDAEKEKRIKLKVIAVDQPSDATATSHTGTASVYVQVFDMNDWSPVFHRVLDNAKLSQQLYAPSILDEPTIVDSYQFSIKENLPAYALVGRISAIDPDVSFWGVIGSVNNSNGADGSWTPRGVSIQFAQGTAPYVENAFTIHSASGQLRTTGPLDREAYANYTFSVVAIDRGPVDGVSRTSTAGVTVTIEDENDNDPVFIRPAAEMADTKGSDESYFEEEAFSPLPQSIESSSASSADTDRIPVVAVSLPVGSGSVDVNSNPIARPLIRIEAQDPDAGANGQIRYAIASGNTDEIFYLDPTTGSLVLKTAYSATKEASNYLLQFEACDQGSPPRCASPARLRIVLGRPAASKSGTSGGIVYSATQDTNPFLSSNRFPGNSLASVGGSAVGYPEVWDGELYGDFGTGWTSSRLKWEEKHRHLREEYEKSGVAYRRSGVSVSEAVVICVAVIFAVFLCAALILVYLVKRKSIYFSIGGKQKHKDVESPADPDYTPGNYKSDNSATCDALESNEKASLYRMIPNTQVPGKIVFVDNNFEKQKLTEGPVSEALALSPIANSKRAAASMQNYSLRRGLSASAAVLTNLESVYIAGPGGPEDSMDAAEYPEVVTRSAFNYPQTVSRDGIQGTELPPAVFRTLIGPKGTAQTINLGQHGEYDAATFQRRCTSLKPASGMVATANPYHYIHPPYAYTPMVGTSPSQMLQCRGISEPNNTDTSPYSPRSVQHRQPYVFTNERHTYHDLDILAATLQRQRRPPEKFVGIAQPGISSSPYGRLRQPISSYAIASSNKRYVAINARMAPDGEVTSLMEPMPTMKRVRIPIAPIAQIDSTGEGEGSRTSDEGASEAFDQQSSPNSLSEAFAEAEFEGDIGGEEEEEPESITDPNAKLIISEGEQTLTLKKMRVEGKQLQTPPHHQPESESQATEEIVVSSEPGFPPSTEESVQQPPPSQLPLTYTVHEASFV